MTKELYQSLRTKLDFAYSTKTLIKHFCIDALFFASIAYLIQQEGLVGYLAAIPIAVLMLRNVSFMHEAVHGTAHPNSKINYFFGLIAGTFCLLPFHLWKKIHMEHHFWAGNYNRDPSLEIMKRYPQIPESTKSVLNFAWKTRIPLTAFAQYIVFWGHATLGLIKNYRQSLLWLNMIIPLAIWGVLIWKLQGHQFAVFGAGIFAYSVLFEVINFPHHVGLYLEDSQTARRPAWQQYEITRTSRYAEFIERLAVLNFNYHAEHHIFPDLPWHQLPKAHALIQNSEAKAGTTVVHGEWLRIQRRSSFGDFVRPELKKQPQPQTERKAA